MRHLIILDIRVYLLFAPLSHSGKTHTPYIQKDNKLHAYSIVTPFLRINVLSYSYTIDLASCIWRQVPIPSPLLLLM